MAQDARGEKPQGAGGDTGIGAGACDAASAASEGGQDTIPDRSRGRGEGWMANVQRGSTNHGERKHPLSGKHLRPHRVLFFLRVLLDNEGFFHTCTFRGILPVCPSLPPRGWTARTDRHGKVSDGQPGDLPRADQSLPLKFPAVICMRGSRSGCEEHRYWWSIFRISLMPLI